METKEENDRINIAEIFNESIVTPQEAFDYSQKFLDDKFGNGFSKSNPHILIQMANSVQQSVLLNQLTHAIYMLPVDIIDELAMRLDDSEGNPLNNIDRSSIN